MAMTSMAGRNASVRELLRAMEHFYEFTSVRIQRDDGRLLFSGSPVKLHNEDDKVRNASFLGRRVKSYEVLASEFLTVIV